MEREPRVAARMHEAVRQRLGREVSERGDIATEEIEEGERSA